MGADKKAPYSPIIGIPDGVYNFGPRCANTTSPNGSGTPPRSSVSTEKWVWWSLGEEV
jgi:hypothetical protein